MYNKITTCPVKYPESITDVDVMIEERRQEKNYTDCNADTCRQRVKRHNSNQPRYFIELAILGFWRLRSSNITEELKILHNIKKIMQTENNI